MRKEIDANTCSAAELVVCSASRPGKKSLPRAMGENCLPREIARPIRSEREREEDRGIDPAGEWEYSGAIKGTRLKMIIRGPARCRASPLIMQREFTYRIYDNLSVTITRYRCIWVMVNQLRGWVPRFNRTLCPSHSLPSRDMYLLF